MQILPDATSYATPAAPLSAGAFRGRTIRYTLRPHGTRDWFIIYTVAGAGLYRYPGGEYRSRAGDITIYRPGAFHDYQFSPETRSWDLIFAHFFPKTEWLEWLDWPEIAPGLMLLHVPESDIRRRVSLRLEEMVRFSFGAQPRRQSFGLNALEEVLLWADAINPRLPSSRVDPRIRKAMDFLIAHFSEPFSEERLALAAGLSPSRLRHLFRPQAGLSPGHFLEEQRLWRAENMLAFSRQTINEIAAELGFASPFYFSLRFKKRTGESPRAFRVRTARDGGGMLKPPPASASK